MDEQHNLVPEWTNVCVDGPVRGTGVRLGPGRPAAWHPASSSAGLVPTGGPPARSSELEEKQRTESKNRN